MRFKRLEVSTLRGILLLRFFQALVNCVAIGFTSQTWVTAAIKARPGRGCVCASVFRYCVLSSIDDKLNRKMQRKVTKAMPKAPSRRKKADAQSSAISLPILNKQPTAGLTPMNFRVSAQFHREFKLYAVQHGMSMVDLLHESFRLMKERPAK